MNEVQRNVESFNDTDSGPQSPSREKSSERAKQLWNILKTSVKQTTEAVKKLDAKPSIVRHGVHHFRKIHHDEALIDTVYNPLTGEYATVDNQFVRLFHKDGRRKDIVNLGADIRKLDFCSQSGQYVALAPPQEIRLYSSEFDLVSVAKSPQRITCMQYNASTNELVVVGPGYLMTWCFRYGNRYLVPHRTVTEGLTCKDCFENLTLERTESNTQRCFAVCGTSVAVFNLFEGKLLTYKKDLHPRNITSILFFNPLKYVITGSRDGSIKVWSEYFDILLVFVGHHGTVSSLSLYPQGPYVMSSSLDATIRVWSLETCDEVDLIKMDDPVLGLGTTPKDSQLFTFSKYAVDLWSITHVHQIFTTIGAPVVKLKMAAHRDLIDRVMCQTDDGIVHILSPVDGTVVTSLPPPSDQLILQESRSTSTAAEKVSSATLSSTSSSGDGLSSPMDAVYSLPLETVFTLFEGTTLVKATTTTNPAKIRRVFTFESGIELTCLCLYEHIINVKRLKDTWDQVRSGAKVTRGFVDYPKYSNKAVLLAGRRDGSVVHIDFFTGDILTTIDAHGTKAVIGLTTNVSANQVISAGRDNVVKVWRIFPNTDEPLALLMSFYCAHLPVNLAIAGSRLAVGFQQPSTATYTIVMYDLESKERYDHSPDFDHTDDLMDLACCRRLKLFASASRDGTIRIWNHDNSLVRVIRVNDDPKSIAFCNQKGDILIGFGKNVHIIRHSDYLPRMNLYRMFCMRFPTQEKEDALPLNERILDRLDPDVAHKIKRAKSSYLSVVHDWDPRTEQEQEKLTFERKDKLGAYSHFAARDLELLRIKDGTLKPKRADRKSSKRTQTRAFRKYLDMFYDRPKKIDIPEVDNFNPDPVVPRPPTPETFKEETKIGFFPPIKTAKPVKDLLGDGMEKEKHYDESGPNYDTEQKYIICPSGFIPNSILIKLLWPQDEVKKLEEDKWKPPVLSGDQLEMLQHMEKATAEAVTEPSAGSETDADRVLLMESDDEWEDKAKFVSYDDEDDDAIGPSAGKSKKSLPGKSSNVKGRKKRDDPGESMSFMDRMKKAMTTPPPPPKEPTPPPTPPPKVESKVKVPTKPSKPLVRFVSRPPPPRDPTPVPPTPPPHTPTPPPPPPPPKYLTQFEGLAWFDRHQDYISQRMNDPPTVLHFFNILCDLLGISVDWDHRSAIADALLLLWQQESMSSARYVIPALGSILNATVPPSGKDPIQLRFLRSAIKLFQVVSGGSEDFVLEVLTEYLEGDHAHRSYLKSVLIEQGLQDPHQYLAKELDSWDIWQLDDSKPMKPQFREMVEKWLKDWSLRFKNHVEDTLERLKKGEVKAKTRRAGLTRTSEAAKRVHFEVPHDGVSKTATPIEVLNYFSEIRLEEELEKTRLANLKPEPSKNTVLVLPKLEGTQAIVRLGEMHTARRVREREEHLASEFKLSTLLHTYPDLMAPFTCKVNLPTKRVYMNPFPSEVDRFDKWSDQYQPILLTLRSPAHQKYFIPERSFVHMA